MNTFAQEGSEKIGMAGSISFKRETLLNRVGFLQLIVKRLRKNVKFFACFKSANLLIYRHAATESQTQS